MTTSSNQRTIVVITNTLFYPARRNGLSVRYYPLIRELHKLGYIVDIILINKDREYFPEHDINALEKLCRAIDIVEPCVHPQSFLIKQIRRIANLFRLLNTSGIPYSLIDNCRQFYLSRVCALLESRNRYDYGIGVGFGGYYADLLLSLKDAIRPTHILCDFVDSPYLLRKRRHSNYASSFNPITQLSDVKTMRRELSLCQHIKCIYISAKDAEAVGNSGAHIVPNCVVEEGFESSHILPLDTPNIGFLGNMSYQPNIDACLFLVKFIYPRLRMQLPDIHLYIVGRHPGKELKMRCNDRKQVSMLY